MDVIVERAVLVAVLAQQTERINIGEVLKLDETVHPVPGIRDAAFNLTGPDEGEERQKKIKK